MKRMHRWLVVGGLLVALPPLHADEYTVTISLDEVRRARVEATIVPDGGVIAMNDEANQGLPRGWSTFVENLRVESLDGSEIAYTYERTSRWRLADHQDGPVRLSYDVKLGHDKARLSFGDNGAAYANDFGVMWSGRALFIAGRESEDVRLRFKLPDGWKLTSAWNATASDPDALLVHTTDDLLNSAVFAGTHTAFDLQSDSATVHFALAGETVSGMKDALGGLVGRYLGYYSETFGPGPQTNMIFIASDSSYWGGEVMGRAISLSVGPGKFQGLGRIAVLSHVIAHEIFHLWGAGITTEEMSPGDLEWFNEGFTAEYFSFVAGVRLGDINAKTFLSQLADHWNKYRQKQDGATSLVAAGKEKDKNYDLVYSGAMVAAAAFDLTVRHRTGGKQSLEDLVRYVFRRYRRPGAGQAPSGSDVLTVDAILDAAKHVYGEELAVLLQRYIQDPGAIPLADVLPFAGIDAKESGGKRMRLSRVAKPTAAQQAVWEGLVGK